MNKKSPLYVLGFMVIIATLCGVSVSFVHYSMRDTLESNMRLAQNRTITKAFKLSPPKTTPEAYETLLHRAVETDSFQTTDRTWKLFYRKGKPRDVGLIFSGMGFWDVITGIIVLSPDLSVIRSLEIIEQKETPGLGARIEENSFKKQFDGYFIDWKKKQPITFGESVSGGSNRIDAITGATQTSLALEKILNSELTAFHVEYLHHTESDSHHPSFGSN